MYSKAGIVDRLMGMAESEYGEFSSSLIPGAPKLLGVRIPQLRLFAKEIAKNNFVEYIENCCKDEEMYFEEIMLWGLVVGYMKADWEYTIAKVTEFIPHIDNWSVNDTFCSTLKITNKNMTKMWDYVLPYFKSEKEFEIRFATIMLMDYYLKEEYIEAVLKIFDSIKHEGYYARMGVAWGIATAFAKFPDMVYDYMHNSNLDDWTYNKSIQKMIESYRVTPEYKQKLRLMKRK